jgi:hypothetical protein
MVLAHIPIMRLLGHWLLLFTTAHKLPLASPHDKLISIALEAGHRYTRDCQQRVSRGREEDIVLCCFGGVCLGRSRMVAELIFHRPSTILRLSPDRVRDNRTHLCHDILIEISH